MVNFICLANSKNAYIRALTQTCIESIVQSKFPAKHSLGAARIIVVESCQNAVQYANAQIIPFDHTRYQKFNYNYALNIGIQYCQEHFTDNDWYCFINNDVIFDKNWLVAMSNAIDFDPTIESFCCNINRVPENVVKYGYATFVHLDGCCILCKASVIQKIGLFDETFDFYFQDDDYCEQLKKHRIKHAKVMNSMAIHVASQTVPERSDMKLLFDGRDKFIAKYGKGCYLQREHEKYQK